MHLGLAVPGYFLLYAGVAEESLKLVKNTTFFAPRSGEILPQTD